MGQGPSKELERRLFRLYPRRDMARFMLARARCLWEPKGSLPSVGHRVNGMNLVRSARSSMEMNPRLLTPHWLTAVSVLGMLAVNLALAVPEPGTPASTKAAKAPPSDPPKSVFDKEDGANPFFPKPPPPRPSDPPRANGLSSMAGPLPKARMATSPGTARRSTSAACKSELSLLWFRCSTPRRLREANCGCPRGAEHAAAPGRAPPRALIPSAFFILHFAFILRDCAPWGSARQRVLSKRAAVSTIR
jgi:hypothetical protein